MMSDDRPRNVNDRGQKIMADAFQEALLEWYDLCPDGRRDFARSSDPRVSPPSLGPGLLHRYRRHFEFQFGPERRRFLGYTVALRITGR